MYDMHAYQQIILQVWVLRAASLYGEDSDCKSRPQLFDGSRVLRVRCHWGQRSEGRFQDRPVWGKTGSECSTFTYQLGGTNYTPSHWKIYLEHLLSALPNLDADLVEICQSDWIRSKGVCIDLRG